MWRTRFARIMEADTIVPFNREVPGGKIIRCGRWAGAAGSRLGVGREGRSRGPPAASSVRLGDVCVWGGGATSQPLLWRPPRRSRTLERPINARQRRRLRLTHLPGTRPCRSITLEKPMLMNGSAAAWPAVSTLLDGQYAAIEAQPVPPLQSQAGVDLGLGPLTHGRKAGSNAAVACASDFAVEMHARAVIKEVERASLRHAGESARLQLMVQY